MTKEDTYPVDDQNDWTICTEERDYEFSARDEDGVPFAIPRD